MWVALAIIWGFSEATLFFIIPDVILTRATLSVGWRRGVGLAFIGAIASTLGAGLMVIWGANNPEAALQTLDHVPAISPPLIEQIDQNIAEGWRSALFWGGFKGQPIKIYAVLLGANGIGWASILPMILLARFVRFFITVSLAQGLKSGLTALLPPKRAKKAIFALWAAIWMAIYAVYFSLFGI